MGHGVRAYPDFLGVKCFGVEVHPLDRMPVYHRDITHNPPLVMQFEGAVNSFYNSSD